MLKPHELALAQGFRPGYQFHGTQSDQTKQIGNARSMLSSREMDEHKGLQLNMQVDELEKTKKMLEEKFKESESRLTDNTAKQTTIDADIQALNAEIASTTKNRNTVDAEILRLGNQYDEARITSRSNKAVEEKQAEKQEIVDKVRPLAKQ
jgi:chromosome segregation ATPase